MLLPQSNLWRTLMIRYSLLLAGQLLASRGDSTYRSAALEKLVDMASRANRTVPQRLLGYDAIIESEVALLVNTPVRADGAAAGTAAGTTEATAQVEQFQLGVSWARDGTFDQRVLGYRARQLSPMVSALSMIPRPWTAPTLFGNRLSLMFGGPPSLRQSDNARRNVPAVHPFADDRNRFYRFSGGDTVATIRGASTLIRVVRIDVEPLDIGDSLMKFAGNVFVDASSGAIVRMRGRIHLHAPAREPVSMRLLKVLAQEREIAYIDFENNQRDGVYWLPTRQRLEYQVTTGLTEARATIRVQSTWHDMQLKQRTDTANGIVDSMGAPRYTLDMTPSDSTARWTSWHADVGALTAEASARDFDDVSPPDLRPTGSVQWRWQARGFSDMIRLNRAEGLFLGVAGLLDFRNALPGTTVRAFGGWAFSARTARGGLEAASVQGAWVASVRAERQLASTSDFSLSVAGATGNIVGTLFGREDVDWVDRRIASVGVMRELGVGHSSALRAEIARASDRDIANAITGGLFGGTFRANRPVLPGDYTRTRVQLELGRNIVTSDLVSGFGATVTYENAAGALSWQRAQLQGVARKTLGRIVIAVRSDAGVLTGKRIPTQQLLEIGGAEGLPGYEYKAFAGDQALLIRSTAQYLLPLWESPITRGRVVVPAVAPRIQVGLFTGRTTATGPTADQLRSLAWITSTGWRRTIDVRLRFFSGALSVGASRALDRRDRWAAAIGVGGTM